MITLVIVAALAALVWFGHRTVKVSRRGDRVSDYLDTNQVVLAGEGRHATFVVVRTDDQGPAEQPTTGAIWQRTATAQAHAVATLDEEATDAA